MFTYLKERRQISLAAEPRQALDPAAARTGRSVSALTRDAVELVYGTSRSGTDDRDVIRRAFGARTDRDEDGAAPVE